MGNAQVKVEGADQLESLKGQRTEFSINGQAFKVGAEVGDMSLNTFIREHAHLKGTKFMCLEGGCGVCVVTVNFTHPVTYKRVSYAVNSCLIRVLSCHGFEITTVEGIGNKYKGYHEVQRRLANANGSQCGYCSPGMVMNMYSLLQENPKMTMDEIENSFGGNICRCTGYRPILDAFKSFAIDAPKELIDKVGDIEDLDCKRDCFACTGKCESNCKEINAERVDIHQLMILDFEDGSQWYRPTTVQEIVQIFDLINDRSYRLVAGYTGHGVYRVDPKPDVYIDINGVSELHGSSISSSGITLGANMSLTETMQLFYQVAKEQPSRYAYCKNLADHMDLVASVPVRNIGTLAGNLFLKHQHNDFQSDIFLLLETVGATVVIHEQDGIENEMSLLEFLGTNMNKKVMKRIYLPTLNNKEYIVTSYKITPRRQNAHAIVNAGFKFRVQKSGKYKVLERPSIVYGGIHRNFVHARKTEEYLTGKTLLFTPVLSKALDTLSSEIFPEIAPPDPSPEYRKGLALSLYYKFVLTLNPDALSPQYRSGGPLLDRPLSSGKQDFDTRKEVWPLNQPVRKIEGMIQTAGEAEYINDIPYFPGQLWGQLVLCTKGKTEIISIDPSAALKMKGVVAFFEAKDIPGENTFCPPRTMFYSQTERVFASGKSDFPGQAVGIIVAETFDLATEATKKVKINYGKSDPIMIDARQIIKDNISSRIREINRITPTAKKDNVKYKVTGEFKVPDQYHYYMEPLSCVSVPNEDKLYVYPNSQWPSVLQDTVGLALNMPEHRINVQVKRLGGAYGAKITLPTHTAIACSLAAVKLHKPVRLVVQLEAGMNWGGKRDPVFAYYEAGVDENGVIQHLDLKIYQDEGFASNDSPMDLTFLHLPSCYDISTWSVVGYGVTTDLPSNTWCRAPGSLEGTIISENIMEHIAHVVKKPAHEVRVANMAQDNPTIQLVSEIRQSTGFDSRVEQIRTFNQNNRWKKRGISLVTMDYPYHYFGPFHGSVSIYRFDGTVAIGHGAIEMGQGCNTKAAQVAAYILGIELDKVVVQPVNNFVSPNNFVTGASLGSESVCFAVMKSCEEINERLKPVREKLGPSAKWLDIITEAYTQNINLRASYKMIPTDIQPYHIYGTSVTEVEVDILTGQFEITRVDLIEDTGESLSPEIDIGQVEGAMIMGFGLFTTEELVYNQTGNLLTDRTWSYKPPGAKDIPHDFRVTLRKNTTNPFGVLRSKATGEPPFCISVSVAFAIREALESARHDVGNDDWPLILLPYTREKMWLGALTTKDMFKL